MCESHIYTLSGETCVAIYSTRHCQVYIVFVFVEEQRHIIERTKTYISENKDAYFRERRCINTKTRLMRMQNTTKTYRQINEKAKKTTKKSRHKNCKKKTHKFKKENAYFQERRRKRPKAKTSKVIND